MTGDPGQSDGREASSDYLYQRWDKFRQWHAELAASVADIEEQIAATFERMAMTRSAEDATRLRAKAADDREYAVQKRIAAHLSDSQAGSPRPDGSAVQQRGAATRPTYI